MLYGLPGFIGIYSAISYWEKNHFKCIALVLHFQCNNKGGISLGNKTNDNSNFAVIDDVMRICNRKPNLHSVTCAKSRYPIGSLYQIQNLIGCYGFNVTSHMK